MDKHKYPIEAETIGGRPQSFGKCVECGRTVTRISPAGRLQKGWRHVTEVKSDGDE